MHLMGDNAPLPCHTENAVKELVRDGKPADQGEQEAYRQREIDDGRNSPPDAPTPARKGRQPAAVPCEMEEYKSAHRNPQRLMQRFRQKREAHQKQQYDQQRCVQHVPFHLLFPLLQSDAPIFRAISPNSERSTREREPQPTPSTCPASVQFI